MLTRSADRAGLGVSLRRQDGTGAAASTAQNPALFIEDKPLNSANFAAQRDSLESADEDQPRLTVFQGVAGGGHDTPAAMRFLGYSPRYSDLHFRAAAG